MKPPHGSMREQGGYSGGYSRHHEGDDGDLLSLSELHGLGDHTDMLDSTETLLVQQVQQQHHIQQQPQQERKVDSDFFNQFQDDFDEDDVRQPANWSELRN